MNKWKWILLIALLVLVVFLFLSFLLRAIIAFGKVREYYDHKMYGSVLINFVIGSFWLIVFFSPAAAILFG